MNVHLLVGLGGGAVYLHQEAAVCASLGEGGECAVCASAGWGLLKAA